jgi:hypothetical protein
MEGIPISGFLRSQIGCLERKKGKNKQQNLTKRQLVALPVGTIL